MQCTQAKTFLQHPQDVTHREQMCFRRQISHTVSHISQHPPSHKTHFSCSVVHPKRPHGSGLQTHVHEQFGMYCFIISVRSIGKRVEKKVSSFSKKVSG